MKKRILSLLMVALMVLNLLPISTSASSTDITTSEAFGAAIATGGEIVLGDDITYETNNAIYIVGKTTIDLNGHTLDIKTGTGTRYSVYIGTSSDSTPELTIKDASNGEGVLNITNGWTSSKSYLMELYGTLDIQGGTINQTASRASSYGIYVNSRGTFKMSGGTLNKGTSLDNGYTLYAGSGTKIVTSGVIEDYYAGNTVSGWEVSGGIFKTQPSYEMMKTGKVTYKIAEGDYVNYFGVTDGTYIGLIGTTMYTSVESFANALGGGKISVEGTKLTLTDDLNLGTGTATKVTFLTSLTLDLAGHDITAEITGPGSSTATVFLFYVNKNDAVVTITDSEGGGMIQNAKTGATAQVSVQTIGANKGTFVIENVTVDATITASNPTNTLFSYPTPVSSLTTDGRIILNGATINAIGQTCRSSAIGVSDNGYCEIDNTTINVSTESTGKGIVSESSSGTLKIGSKNNGKTKINVHGYGNEPTYVATCLSGITNSDDEGASGAVTIANTDVSIVSEIGSGTKPQRCQGIFLGDTSNGVKEIGDNVSVSISGQSAQSSTYPEVHGIRASGGGTINGTNVSVNITHENAIKTYGIYLNGSQDFVINPGTNVVVDVTEATGTVYKVFAYSTGKILIADGLYKGGDMAGVIASGGVFDQDPSTSCDLGYVSQANTPSAGLWTVVPDTRTVIKNLTQDEKEYSNIIDAIAEAQNHDELQLMTDVLSNAVLNVANINLDLNGYDLAVGSLNTSGDVTITDKQATSYENAGTLTACVNVAAGNVLFTKIKHRTEGTIAPFKVEADTAEVPAKLTLAGVNGEYTGPTMVTSALNNSDITINDNVPGFTTSLKLMNTSTSVCYIFSGASGKENKTTINGGEFEINVNASAQLFQTYAKALVNDGKFKITSTGNANARIANNTNANIDIQGGYFVGTSKDGLVDKAVFFANATKLAKDGKNAIDLETTDPLYAEGYRYTIATVAIAKNRTTEYTNLQDAIDEASDGDTITLLSNVVYRDFVLDKNLTFEGAYTVTLIGDKPLTLGADLEVPSCFDISSAKLYVEKNNGEKVYYTSWIAYTQPNNTGAIVDYDSATCKQLVLLTNMTVASSLSVYKSCTIDLNGYTIAGNNTTYETLTVRNDDTAVVIKDSSKEQTGKITGSNNNYYTVLVEHDGTSFTLDGGTIENTSEMGAGICAMGDSYNYCENAAIVINGGAIVTGGGFAITDNGQYSRNVDLTINGGEIDAGDGVAIYKPASGTITLNGGTISGGTGLYVRSGEFIVPEDSTIMIRATGEVGGHGSTTGAAYNTGDAVAIDVSDYPGGNPTADIAGGAFYSENAYAIASYTSCATPAITGFLRGGIYGADTAAIDIMDVDTSKDLIATGYTDIPNPDTETNEDHPWMIGVAPKEHVAKIIVDDEEIFFDDLEEAIEAAKEAGVSVILEEKIEIEGGLEIEVDSESTQDEAGVSENIIGQAAVEAAQNIAKAINDAKTGTNKSEVVNLTETVANYLTSLDLEKLQTIAEEKNKGEALETFLNEASEAAKGGKNVEITMNVTTDVAVEVVDVQVDQNNDKVITTFVLDIKPYYTLNIVTKTMDGEEDPTYDELEIITEEMHEELNVPETTVVTFPAPEGFTIADGDELFVLHTKDNGQTFTYGATYVPETNMISFINPDGFSEFKLLKSSGDAVAQNTRTGELYTVLQTGLDAAAAGDTVIILKDLTTATGRNVDFTIVKPNITLDLNGFNLESEYTLVYGLITNSAGFTGNVANGELLTARNNLSYMGGKTTTSNDYVLPVWVAADEAYVFCSVSEIGQEWTDAPDGKGGTKPKYRFWPVSDTIGLIFPASGDSGISVYVEIKYSTDGSSMDQMEVDFGQSYIDKFMLDPDGSAMYLSLMGAEDITVLKATTYLRSDVCNFNLISEQLTK